MKYVTILMLLSFSAFSQVNHLPESEVIKAINLEPNAGSVSCKDRPDEKCYSYEGIQWETAELVDNEVLDFIKKSNEVKCELKEIEPSESDIKMFSYEDCDKKVEALDCGKNEKIKNYDIGEVYCIKNIMKIDGKKLVNSPEKKKKHEEKLKDIEDKRKAKSDKKASLKNIDIDKINTVKELKAIVKDLIELQE